MQKKISIFSFFSGIGILDLAFEKNGYNIVFVNEYDNLFIESYQYARMQMNLRAPIYGYRNDSAERYARRRGKKNLLALIAQEREKGNLVGFIGGPPCPDFSVAGKNAGVDGENGRLTKIYFDIICRCHPDFFLFENVNGLVKTEKHRAFYKEMMMKVQANDYVIAENVLNALAYGVPQFRERVFMVGIHKKIYQNEPNALIFKWDKHALFNTENVLTRTWPKEREFAPDSSYVFPAKGILKKLTVEYWFHKNPRVIKHLGRDLITSPEVAIIELIKNSIDAKASHINLRLYNSMPSNELIPDCVSDSVPNKYLASPILVVEDDGCGMTDATIDGGFLKIATDIKSNEKSTLGEKGIGRLAAQRLGTALLVEKSTDCVQH